MCGLLLGLIATGSALNPVYICAPALPSVGPSHALPRECSKIRAESPEGGFVLTLPTDSNLFGARAGDYEPAISGGYYLLLARLSVGEHELHFRAVVGDPDEPDFEVDVIYHLTVAPRNK